MKYQTTTAQETEQIGKKIAQTLTGGAVVLLYGELGAGKTTPLKGIARAPGGKELIDMGVEDYLGSKNSVCVIEWPEKLTTILKSKKTIKVLMENIDKEKRKIIMNY